MDRTSPSCTLGFLENQFDGQAPACHPSCRTRFLTQRLDIAEVVDPSLHHGGEQVFFGATVRVVNRRDEERTITIKGIDEADSAKGEVSWIAPIARALLKARVGDEVSFEAPGGVEELEVLEVRYPAPERRTPR